LSIHAPQHLSGIFGAATAAAQAFENKVHVVDSHQLTLGMGYQVLAAARAALEGANLEKISAVVEDVRRRVRVIAMLDTLEYVHRSGRVSWAKARLGTLLNLKPLIEVRNGEILSLGQVRTRRKGIERLKELLQELGSLEQAAMLHTNAEDDARQLLADAQLSLDVPALVVNITTVIGTHVGPQGLGFAVVLK
jgi:DegV family protein with EDD domain